MKVRYAKKSEKEIAIKFWKDSFKDNEEQIKFYYDNIYNEKNYLVLEDNSKISPLYPIVLVNFEYIIFLLLSK